MDPGVYVLFGVILATVIFIGVWDTVAERVNRKRRQQKR